MFCPLEFSVVGAGLLYRGPTMPHQGVQRLPLAVHYPPPEVLVQHSGDTEGVVKRAQERQPIGG